METMMSERVEMIGPATLILADCREVLGDLAPVDVLLTDPPYGQAAKVNTFHAGGTREKDVVQRNGRSLKVRPKVHRPIHGDDRPFDPTHLIGLAPLSIIWGAHKFADRLPRGSWLVWDKVPTGKLRSQGDGEAAWDSRPDRPLRICRLLWDGLCVAGPARHEVTAGQQRLHPTQKPEALIHWTLEHLPMKAGTVLDPYMGAGSTGVAAVARGFKFIGIEIDPEYFEMACRRIEAVVRQPSLFQEAAA